MVPMTATPLMNLAALIDDAKCFELVRQQRWPDGVRCPTCSSAAVTRHGRDDAQPHRQRYRCTACDRRFDDLVARLGVSRATLADRLRRLVFRSGRHLSERILLGL